MLNTIVSIDYSVSRIHSLKIDHYTISILKLINNGSYQDSDGASL